LGSGNLLLKAVKKYGKENFTKEILYRRITQYEADRLEIHEIMIRGVLADKDKWYNLDAGGQYNRSEQHSEITSKAMKGFYADDYNYTHVQILNNRSRYMRGLKPTNYSTLAHKDIFKLKKSLIAINKKRSSKEKTKIDKLIKNSRKDPNRMSKGGYAVWENKRYHLIAKQVEAHKRRKQLSIESDSNYFSDDTRKEFALAKVRSANNLLGVHILSECDVYYKLIGSKVKKFGFQ